MKYDYSQDLANELLENADRKIDELEAKIKEQQAHIAEFKTHEKVFKFIKNLEDSIDGDPRVRIGLWRSPTSRLQYLEIIADWKGGHMKQLVAMIEFELSSEDVVLGKVIDHFNEKYKEAIF